MLFMQGIPITNVLLGESHTHDALMQMAGNAFNGYFFSTWIIAALVLLPLDFMDLSAKIIDSGDDAQGTDEDADCNDGSDHEDDEWRSTESGNGSQELKDDD